MYKHKVQTISNCIGQRLVQELATREHLRETSWFEQRLTTVRSGCRRGGQRQKGIRGNKPGKLLARAQVCTNIVSVVHGSKPQRNN